MSPAFKRFVVEGAADFLKRSVLLDNIDWGPNRVSRTAVNATREYEWDRSKRCYSVSSVSGSTAEYYVFVDQVYCTCYAYKKAMYPDKSCVHIRDIAHEFHIAEWLRSPLYLIVSTKERVAFRKFSNDRVNITPEWFARVKTEWLYSTKRDGVRVLYKKNGEVVTANGLRLLHVEYALRSAEKHPPRIDLECELTTCEGTSSARVQREILHAMGSVEYDVHFKLWVFDVFNSPDRFEERTQRAQQEAERCGLERVEQHELSELQDVVGLFEKLRKILTEEKQEGLILQRKDERYHAGRRSSKSNNLKLKQVPKKFLTYVAVDSGPLF